VELPLLVTELEVALAGVIASAAVGVVTPFFGWLVARGNRRHERRLAHDARVFEHRATLYDELLRDLLAEVRDFWMKHRAAEGEPIGEEPTWPDPEWLHRLSTTGSDEVQNAVRGFVHWASRFHSAWSTHEKLFETERPAGETEALRRDFCETMGIESGSEEQLVRQMITEAAEGAREQLHVIEHAARRELMEFQP
jgi:hypothetical protein